MRTCISCGGIIGRDCFNPVECAQITASMNNPYEFTYEENDKLKIQRGKLLIMVKDFLKYGDTPHMKALATNLIKEITED